MQVLIRFGDWMVNNGLKPIITIFGNNQQNSPAILGYLGHQGFDPYPFWFRILLILTDMIWYDYLVGGFNPSEKYEFVNGKDESHIWNGK